MGSDRRLVQTAVIGNPDSQDPAMIPREAAEAEAFRAEHAETTFWCGSWLGGCRAALHTRVPTARASHFVHNPSADPDAPRCGRASMGEASADHLYARRSLLAWYAAHEIAVNAAVSPAQPGGPGPGEELLIEPQLGPAAVRLTFSASSDSGWSGETISGIDVEPDTETLLRRGYINRHRFVSEGATRRLQIGTRLSTGTTTWFDLSECKPAEWGVSTPAVEEVRAARASRRAIGGPKTRAASRAPGRPVAAPVLELDREGVFTDLTIALDGGASVSVLKRALHRAEYASEGGRSSEEDAQIRRAYEVVNERTRGVGAPASGAEAVPARRVKRPRRQRTAAPPPSPVPSQAPRLRSAAPGPSSQRSTARQPAEAQRSLIVVEELLTALRRREGRPGKHTDRLVKQLIPHAGKADALLSPMQRAEIERWKRLKL